MKLSRRSFLARSAGVAGALLVLPSCDGKDAPSPELLLNHAGFTPAAGKSCVLPGVAGTTFEIVDAAGGRVVHQGKLEPRKGDHGNYLVGDFSELGAPGQYRVQSGRAQSGSFTVADGVYLPAIRNSIAYFAVQRCGDSKSGFHAPCHLDDGVRKDTGERLDVTGGWHDACDVRKWVDATIYGMIGLSRVLDAVGPQSAERAQIVDELRWGNRYFLKMQDPAGFVMNYCGGDDGNHFTDNKIGSTDDRRIHVEPAEMTAQFNFVTAQAAMARHTSTVDPEYAKSCEKAGEKALRWCIQRGMAQKASTLGAAVLACVELHRAWGGKRPSELAGRYLKALVALQVTADAEPKGFFLQQSDRSQPSREIMDGNLPLIALCTAITQFSDHRDVEAWRAALKLHVDHLVAMSQRSAFGTIPFGLYAGDDPGGGRRIGDYFYRWSMKTAGEYRDDDWWVGINAHLASHGIGLLLASKVLNRPDLAHLAQRQLDWILGGNPFNASTVTGAGRNQPKLYATSAFKPTTPLIPGAVMNGLGGTASDQLCIDAGSWNTCEYWTPMVAYTMWLMAALNAAT
jgi:hypothetical protein